MYRHFQETANRTIFFEGIVISLQYINFTLKNMTQALFTKQRTLYIYMRCI